MTSQTEIVDTNVILVANGQHQDISPACVLNCVSKLQTIVKQGRIVLDDEFLILSEYQNKTQANRGKGVGDVFVKWALRNRMSEKCDLIPLKEHPDRGFESFPDEPDLANFDAPDRKFVAVASAHNAHPPILQAADSKWLDWAPALKRHDITVEFVCPGDIQRFHENKFGT